MVKFQYCSDIHLEFYDLFHQDTAIGHNFERIIRPAAAPYLVLAGDIGQPHLPLFRQFFEWCSQHWLEIFYVTGNHEYYSAEKPPLPMDYIEDEIAGALKGLDNVHWLCQGCPGGTMSRDISGTNVTIVGTTLWTYIDEEDEAVAKAAMMDYRVIGTPYGVKEARPIEPYEISVIHMLQKQNLANEIRAMAARGRRIVVVTHHLPSFKLVASHFKGSALNCCFAAGCDGLIEMPGVIAWIYGHTHDVREMRVGSCLCVVNAVGYPGEKKMAPHTDAVLDLEGLARSLPLPHGKHGEEKKEDVLNTVDFEETILM